MAEGEVKKEAETKKVEHTYALVKTCDMTEEIKNEAVDLIVTACEKHAPNNFLAARMIKESMDKKFQPSWNAVVGEAYGFEIDYLCSTLLFMLYGGNLGIVTWKCS
ncbi:dynein axonemal light chain 4-like [Schistocerca americana]|uniref:dynein axonemal light chain 4-like n=1 Tax=Schistocerca americana TaxID=7009 RepID=UPI001F4F3C24|nr:dynein axonemal light chain 4-like [Schistocerca americana]XP_047110265.1 dynein axonemal light chain 4-like [Schistocerca piceifrons]XP_049772026.1 dynein axonemal light chain 4-like [Schistocerca cancellata]XP_049803839.1 dynein axonemal light chain 4-like [Schistocerca nitens]XP_049853096.1 dynein axonemal light chain 4-like [Schistocerca gregaria]XP_049949223.1 dynein axonemal light chain 4-like [Schistocerca serialis cubense]